MSTQSTYGKYIFTKSTEIATDAPLSANKMMTLQNNLQHLVDCHGQYRVHYAAPSTGGLHVENSAYDIIYEARVPWSYINTKGIPFSPYLKVTGQADTSYSIRVLATLGWLQSASHDYADALFYGNVLSWLGSEVTSTTDTTLAEAIIDCSDNEKLRLLSIWKNLYNVDELDESAGALASIPVEEVELRFSLFVLGHGYINYIQLREFCQL